MDALIQPGSQLTCLILVVMEDTEEPTPLRITPTVRALSSALRGKRENAPDSRRGNGDRIFPEPEKLWFKESSAKNLRSRDFLSPTTMLNTMYADGQVGLADTCWICHISSFSFWCQVRCRHSKQTQWA